MLNKHKIRIMTNLAIYDKNIGVKDKEKNEMLQFDYVYRSNFWARISAFFGCLIILAFYVVKLILVDQIDLFNFDYKGEVTNILYFIVGVLVFYTIVNGAIANVEYMKSQRRLQKYYRLLDTLDGEAQNPQLSHQKNTAKAYKSSDDYEDEDDYKDYTRRPKSRADTGLPHTKRLIEDEDDDDDDDIPANKYPDTRLRTRTSPQTFTRTGARRVPASSTKRQTPQSRNVPKTPVSLRGSRATPNLSATKGAVKGKDGKFTSD